MLAFASLFAAQVHLGAQEPSGSIELQRGFRSVELGLGFDDVEERLQSEGAFAYRGQPDVSMQLSDGERVIDTEGRGFVERGLLQFAADRLYILTMYLNTSRLDYFILFERLRESYGDPVDLDPRRAYWEDDRTRIELERPLTVRYLDLETFERRRAESQQLQATEDLSREDFLGSF